MSSAAPPFDPALFKAQTRDHWDMAAEGWNAQRSHLRAWLREATASMLDLAQITTGHHVLDIAAGAGDQTLDIAERVGPNGYVLATDLSPRIVELARQNIAKAGHRNVDVHVADGEQPELSQSFDAAICRLGLMLFPDPVAGVTQLLSALRPGGYAAALVFSNAASNPCIVATVKTALKHAGLTSFDPDRPGGLLSLGKPGLMTSLFERAGFRDVVTQNLSAPMRLPSTDDYLQFVRTSAGPILQLMSQLDESARDAAWMEMASHLKQFETTGGWVGPKELLLTCGRR